MQAHEKIRRSGGFFFLRPLPLALQTCAASDYFSLHMHTHTNIHPGKKKTMSQNLPVSLIVLVYRPFTLEAEAGQKRSTYSMQSMP